MIDELLNYHDDETVAREIAEGYLAAAERHVEAYRVLERHAGERAIPVARLDAWHEWREAAEMLATTGKAVLAEEERYGAYLDAMPSARPVRGSRSSRSATDSTRNAPSRQSRRRGRPGASRNSGRRRDLRIGWTMTASLRINPGRRSKGTAGFRPHPRQSRETT